MNAATALRLLRQLDVPVVSTSDAAALLDLSPGTASKTMERLAMEGLIRRLRRGLWFLDTRIDPYLVAGYIVAPYPAYISLWSALYLHGLVDQIPSSIFVVSLARTQHIRTSLGTYSIHHLAPEVFGGFEIQERNAVQLATAEKAVFDLAYLSSSRARLFAATPELDLPTKFRWTVVYEWVGRIATPGIATRVRVRIEELRRKGGCHRAPSRPRASARRRSAT